MSANSTRSRVAGWGEVYRWTFPGLSSSTGISSHSATLRALPNERRYKLRGGIVSVQVMWCSPDMSGDGDMHRPTLCSVTRKVPGRRINMVGFQVGCRLILAIQTASTARGVSFQESIGTVRGR